MNLIHAITAAALLTGCGIAKAQFPVNYDTELAIGATCGKFAPYFIASNHHGVITQPDNAQARASLWRDLDLKQRFSYGFGADIIGGYASQIDYERFDPLTHALAPGNKMRPPTAWVQQLYGEVKFRGVFLTAGLKEYQPALVNAELSSGDLTFSGNTRPIPGARCGFIDFQDIPFTNGWVQIQGEVGYNESTDNNWTEDHFNYYNGRINRGWWYNYKRCYFRTNPTQPLSITVGSQAAAQFGGTLTTYQNGIVTNSYTQPTDLKTFFDMIVPSWGEDFVTGNHVGSWDFKARYRFRSSHQIAAYFEWPWEDGSGVGKLNGWDGLWGIEYTNPSPNALVKGAVVEYLDFTNQSGPIHWSPADYPGTTVTGHAEGNDSYYNNNKHNGYAIYGMSIGTPFLRSPLYNLAGQNSFVYTRVRGFHLGVNGALSPTLSYRLLAGYRKTWGNHALPSLRAIDNTSMLIEGVYSPSRIAGMSVKASLAFDSGRLYGNNFGALITCSYSGKFTL